MTLQRGTIWHMMSTCRVGKPLMATKRTSSRKAAAIRSREPAYLRNLPLGLEWKRRCNLPNDLREAVAYDEKNWCSMGQ